jgi:hypothetical protein
MEQEIVYKATAQELRELLLEPLKQAVIAEYRAKWNTRIINIDAVALIHDVDPQTVRAYVKSGDITCEPRIENAPYRFRLGYVLEINFKELNLKLRNKR